MNKQLIKLIATKVRRRQYSFTMFPLKTDSKLFHTTKVIEYKAFGIFWIKHIEYDFSY